MQLLQSHYHFTCACARCAVDIDSTAEDHAVGGWKCAASRRCAKAGGLVLLSVDEYDDSSDDDSGSCCNTGVCTLCGRTADAEPLLVSVYSEFLLMCKW
jgi:hypothetical protein